MGRPITGEAGAVYAILKAKMTSQLSSKTMANWRTCCTFTEVRGDIQGRIKDFCNGRWLIPIATKQCVNLFQVALGLSQKMAIKEL